MLAEAGADSPRLPRLRILRSTAAELPGAAVQAIRRRISPNLHTLYGTSEAGPIAVATPQILAEHPTSVGRVLPGVELQIVNERDEPLASGAVGFVRLRGPGVAGGYLRADPEEQARAFRGGWFYPGDLATKNEDDLLYLKGRADDVMNFDGILVGPSEIESVVRQHPGVIEAAAFAVPSLEHQDVPAVAIVASQPLPIDELSRFCNDRLGVRAPRFFMQVGEIPKNPMGKVLRRRLSELAQAKLQEGARR
jgi:acyl-coenzyme A synthetase/AMP-(fatty) acid ligase